MCGRRCRRWRRCWAGRSRLHTNGFDEALSLPTENAARIALRTQQILAHESGVAQTVDPLAGSYYVESLTNEIERRADGLSGDDCRVRRVRRQVWDAAGDRAGVCAAGDSECGL